MTETAYTQAHADQYPAMPPDALALLGSWETGAYFTLCPMRGCNNEVFRGTQGEPCTPCQQTIDHEFAASRATFCYD